MFGKKKAEEEQHYETGSKHGCTGDKRLRDHGFTIKHRVPNHPAIWERNGIAFTEKEAHELIDEETTYADRSKTRPQP